MKISFILRSARFKLDDLDVKNWTDEELLTYFNYWNEHLYKLLVIDRSELVRTGSGTIAGLANTEVYALSGEGITDLWVPYRVWEYGKTPLTLGAEQDRMEYEQANGVAISGEPEKYYLEGGTIGILPAPAVNTTFRIKYWPIFSPAYSEDQDIPYLAIFARTLEEGVVMLAKNRGRRNATIETSLMQLHQDIESKIMRMRRKARYQFTPEV